MSGFFRRVNISCKTFAIDKKNYQNGIETYNALIKELSSFVKEYSDVFNKYDKIKIYYDNGQHEVTKLMSSIFLPMFNNVEIKYIESKDYRLFQLADYVCTLRLLDLKITIGDLSKSEKYFFENKKNIQKSYIEDFYKKEFNTKNT